MPLHLLNSLRDGFRGLFVSKEEAKGKIKKEECKIREGMGKITGEKSEQIKGEAEQVKGKIQDGVGKAKRKA